MGGKASAAAGTAVRKVGSGLSPSQRVVGCLQNLKSASRDPPHDSDLGLCICMHLRSLRAAANVRNVDRVLALCARNASSKATSKGVTRTRKKYIDMPAGYALSDGVVKAPLSPFDGGLRPKATRVRSLTEEAVAAG